MTDGERYLRDMLTRCGLPEKPSYTRAEVCRILGITRHTFWRLTNQYEPGRTNALDSFVLRTHRRVPFIALARFITDNLSYERQCGHPSRRRPTVAAGG